MSTASWNAPGRWYGALLAATIAVVPARGQAQVMGGTLTEPLATETQERVKALGLTQDWDEPPARLKFERPKYPESASKKGIEGTVILEVVIDARGRVAQTRVLQSISALDAAAVKCVKKWSFRPAKKAGRPVATLVHVPVTFRIPSPQVNVEPDVERAPKGSIDPPGGLRQMGPLAFDPEGADFTPWINHFKEEIYRNWILPRAAEFGFRGHVDFEFTVERDGTITGLHLILPSGTVALDRAAESALLKSRFLPLPSDFASPNTKMNVRFFYNESLPAPPR